MDGNSRGLGTWYRQQRKQGVRPAVAGTITVAEPTPAAGPHLCPACGHEAHPGQVCMVDVGEEPCNCDCGLDDEVEFDEEDRPYRRL